MFRFSSDRSAHPSLCALIPIVLMLVSCLDNLTTTSYDVDVFVEPKEEEVSLVPATVRPAPEGPLVTVHAVNLTGPQTKTYLEDDGDVVSVQWSSGDEFHAHFFGPQGESYDAGFVTSTSGQSVDFSTESLLDGVEFSCFYPGFTEMRVDERFNSHAFGMNLPHIQNAVENGIESGVNLSYAYAGELSDGTNLYFHNIPSLIRFQLSGGIVEDITEIKLKATYNVTGIAYIADDNGMPMVYPLRDNDSFRSPTVTLKGTFEEGKLYYIAVWPGTTHGFEMTFASDGGNYSTLQSSKDLTFSRSTIEDFGTINLGSTFSGNNNISTETIKYMTASEGTKPATIAIVPDGFTLEELSQYERYAKMGIDYMFETEPYKTYKNRFNVYIFKVPSEESGVSITDGNGTIITPVNNYFGTKRADKTYGDLQAVDDRVYNYVTENCPDIISGKHTIQEVPILLLLNDHRYGGMTWPWGDGKAIAVVPIIYSGGALQWSYPLITAASESDPNAGYRETTYQERLELGTSVGDWRNAVVHEYGGHAFGRLTDEYWPNESKYADHNKIYQRQKKAKVPYALNVSASYSTPPWQILLNKRDELIAKNERYSRIGVFQGAYNSVFDAWRSEQISCMIDNRPYFSAWQRYLIVQRIFTLCGDSSKFTFEQWLANDVTIDPVRDIETRSFGFGFNDTDIWPSPPFAMPDLMFEEE